MISEFCGKPTEEELRNRILRQLEWRHGENEAALLWRGYLAALFEWSAIDLPAYERLSMLLPDVGSSELFELFGDEKNTPEQEQEIEKYRRR
ncbi:hypothetical protein ACN9MB_11225 [Dyella kyungheensis]|jgi:hypothetical protein|uniref:hypothetical protein n=1 Tax=Dyella kyungheensis TaxID=1242174 RepID=UPI003CF71377